MCRYQKNHRVPICVIYIHIYKQFFQNSLIVQSDDNFDKLSPQLVTVANDDQFHNLSLKFVTVQSSD